MYYVSGTVLDLGDIAINKMWLLLNERNIKQLSTALTIYICYKE